MRSKEFEIICPKCKSKNTWIILGSYGCSEEMGTDYDIHISCDDCNYVEVVNE